MGLNEKFRTAGLCHSIDLLQAMVSFFQIGIALICEINNSANEKYLIRCYAT